MATGMHVMLTQKQNVAASQVTSQSIKYGREKHLPSQISPLIPPTGRWTALNSAECSQTCCTALSTTVVMNERPFKAQVT